jgi:hypothetical protein
MKLSNKIENLENRIAKLEVQSALNDPFLKIIGPTDPEAIADYLEFNTRGVAYIEDDRLFASKIMKRPQLILDELILIEWWKMGYGGRAGERNEFGEVMYDEMDDWVASGARKRYEKYKRSKLIVKQVVSPRTGKNGWVLTLK